MPHQLLIIHSSTTERKSVLKNLSCQDWQLIECESYQQAKDAIFNKSCHPLVILAQQQNNEIALNSVSAIQHKLPYTEWIFLLNEAHSSIDNPVNELAYDILHAPTEKHRLHVILHRAQRSALTRWQLNNAANVKRQIYNPAAYLGDSEQVKQLRSMILQLAQVPLNTLIITGETGTGKGLTAKIVHHTGQRKHGPLIELNCAALPRDLLESQLFGHESGAFTGARQRHHGLFEQADGGTLFLDEISELDLDLQAKLLKAIEDKTIRRLGSESEIKVDVQIITAASRRLEESVSQGDFRDDLFHRLNVFSLHLPPLRERKQDLLQLVPSFIANFNKQAGKNVSEVPDVVWNQLFDYDWPGNIRELQNVIERCVLLSKANTFPVQWLQLSQHALHPDTDTKDSPNTLNLQLDGQTSLDDMEHRIIAKALALSGFNVSQAAKLLCTTREKLRYRIKKHKILTNRQRPTD